MCHTFPKCVAFSLSSEINSIISTTNVNFAMRYYILLLGIVGIENIVTGNFDFVC